MDEESVSEQDLDDAQDYYDKVVKTLEERRHKLNSLNSKITKLENDSSSSTAVAGVKLSAARMAANAAFVRKNKEVLVRLHKKKMELEDLVKKAEERLVIAQEDIRTLTENVG